FLVPTPTEPKLGEVDQSIFDRLEEWTKPREVVVRRPRPRERFGRGSKAEFGMPGGGMPMAAAPPVEGLGRQTAAGMDAAMLKATETKALQDWLKKHGYSTRQALDSWLDRYVKDGWVITAFKFTREPAAPGEGEIVPAPGGLRGRFPGPPSLGTRA